MKAETAATVKDIGEKLRNTLRNPSASPDDAVRTYISTQEQPSPLHPLTPRTPPETPRSLTQTVTMKFQPQAEALELLQMLKMPQDELQREWLSERRKALSDAMHRAGEAFWAQHAQRQQQQQAEGGAGAATVPVDVHEFVRFADKGFLTELIKTSNQYKEARFLPFPRPHLLSDARPLRCFGPRLLCHVCSR